MRQHSCNTSLFPHQEEEEEVNTTLASHRLVGGKIKKVKNPKTIKPFAPAHSKQSSKTTATEVSNAWGWGMEAEIPGPASFTIKLPRASALPNRI